MVPEGEAKMSDTENDLPAEALDRAWQAFCDAEEKNYDYAAALAAAIKAAEPYLLLRELRRLVELSREQPLNVQAEELDVQVAWRIRELESATHDPAGVVTL